MACSLRGASGPRVRPLTSMTSAASFPASGHLLTYVQICASSTMAFKVSGCSTPRALRRMPTAWRRTGFRAIELAQRDAETDQGVGRLRGVRAQLPLVERPRGGVLLPAALGGAEAVVGPAERATKGRLDQRPVGEPGPDAVRRAVHHLPQRNPVGH